MTNSIADLATTPPGLTISTYEGPLTVAIDTTARLATGQTEPISPNVRLLINNDSGTLVTLTDGCSVNGANILQPIRGTELTPTYEYLLIATFGDGAGNVQSTFTSIWCPI
jgi:hypothetical protein